MAFGLFPSLPVLMSEGTLNYEVFSFLERSRKPLGCSGMRSLLQVPVPATWIR